MWVTARYARKRYAAQILDAQEGFSWRRMANQALFQLLLLIKCAFRCLLLLVYTIWNTILCLALLVYIDKETIYQLDFTAFTQRNKDCAFYFPNQTGVAGNFTRGKINQPEKNGKIYLKVIAQLHGVPLNGMVSRYGCGWLTQVRPQVRSIDVLFH